MNNRLINPANLNDANLDAEILGALLLQSKKEPVLFSHRPYAIKFKDEMMTVELWHSVIQRVRNNQRRIKGVRHEVQGEMIAAGGYARVYNVICTLKLEENRAETCQSQKSRVMKIQNYMQDGDDFFFERNIAEQAFYNEVEQSLLALHLHAKPPTIIEDSNELVQSIIIFRKHEGPTLYHTIKNNSLHVNDKLALSINILRAWQQHVGEYNMVHYDLTAENLIVDPHKLTVTIIDYAGAKRIGQTHGQMVIGTNGYLAPEANPQNKDIFLPDIHTESDAFSIGVLLRNLWGDNAVMLDHSQPLSLKKLFCGLKELKDETHANILFQLLTGMTNSVMAWRRNMDDALNVIVEIQWQCHYSLGLPVNSLTVDRFKYAYLDDYNSTFRFFRNPCSTMLKRLASADTMPKFMNEIIDYARRNPDTRTAKIITKFG